MPRKRGRATSARLNALSVAQQSGMLTTEVKSALRDAVLLGGDETLEVALDTFLDGDGAPLLRYLGLDDEGGAAGNSRKKGRQLSGLGGSMAASAAGEGADWALQQQQQQHAAAAAAGVGGGHRPERRRSSAIMVENVVNTVVRDMEEADLGLGSPAGSRPASLGVPGAPGLLLPTAAAAAAAAAAAEGSTGAVDASTGGIEPNYDDAGDERGEGSLGFGIGGSSLLPNYRLHERGFAATDTVAEAAAAAAATTTTTTTTATATATDNGHGAPDLLATTIAGMPMDSGDGGVDPSSVAAEAAATTAATLAASSMAAASAPADSVGTGGGESVAASSLSSHRHTSGSGTDRTSFGLSARASLFGGDSSVSRASTRSFSAALLDCFDEDRILSLGSARSLDLQPLGSDLSPQHQQQNYAPDHSQQPRARQEEEQQQLAEEGQRNGHCRSHTALFVGHRTPPPPPSDNATSPSLVLRGCAVAAQRAARAASSLDPRGHPAPPVDADDSQQYSPRTQAAAEAAVATATAPRLQHQMSPPGVQRHRPLPQVPGGMGRQLSPPPTVRSSLDSQDCEEEAVTRLSFQTGRSSSLMPQIDGERRERWSGSSVLGVSLGRPSQEFAGTRLSDASTRSSMSGSGGGGAPEEAAPRLAIVEEPGHRRSNVSSGSLDFSNFDPSQLDGGQDLMNETLAMVTARDSRASSFQISVNGDVDDFSPTTTSFTQTVAAEIAVPEMGKGAAGADHDTIGYDTGMGTSGLAARLGVLSPRLSEVVAMADATGALALNMGTASPQSAGSSAMGETALLAQAAQTQAQHSHYQHARHQQQPRQQQQHPSAQGGPEQQQYASARFDLRAEQPRAGTDRNSSQARPGWRAGRTTGVASAGEIGGDGGSQLKQQLQTRVAASGTVGPSSPERLGSVGRSNVNSPVPADVQSPSHNAIAPNIQGQTQVQALMQDHAAERARTQTQANAQAQAPAPAQEQRQEQGQGAHTTLQQVLTLMSVLPPHEALQLLKEHLGVEQTPPHHVAVADVRTLQQVAAHSGDVATSAAAERAAATLQRLPGVTPVPVMQPTPPPLGSGGVSMNAALASAVAARDASSTTTAAATDGESCSPGSTAASTVPTHIPMTDDMNSKMVGLVARGHLTTVERNVLIRVGTGGDRYRHSQLRTALDEACDGRFNSIGSLLQLGATQLPGGDLLWQSSPMLQRMSKDAAQRAAHQGSLNAVEAGTLGYRGRIQHRTTTTVTATQPATSFASATTQAPPTVMRVTGPIMSGRREEAPALNAGAGESYTAPQQGTSTSSTGGGSAAAAAHPGRASGFAWRKSSVGFQAPGSAAPTATMSRPMYIPSAAVARSGSATAAHRVTAPLSSPLHPRSGGFGVGSPKSRLGVSAAAANAAAAAPTAATAATSGSQARPSTSVDTEQVVPPPATFSPVSSNSSGSRSEGTG